MYKDKITVYVEGEELELYTIGYVAKLLKKSVETVRAWERAKVIPRPMYRAKNNVRLYHPKEVAVMKKILKKDNRSKWPELKADMWRELAIVRQEILNGSKEKEK